MSKRCPRRAEILQYVETLPDQDPPGWHPPGRWPRGQISERLRPSVAPARDDAGWGAPPPSEMSVRAPFLQYVEASPAHLSFLATGIALLTIALHTASLNQHHQQERMSSSNKQNRPRTSFEMVADDRDQEHPIDLLVASRLPQTELRASIRANVDELIIILGEDRSLWIEIERKLNERHGARSEEYFNLGYEYGLATGRAQALETLRANGTSDTQQLAERLGALVKNEALPANAVVAVLLEVTWALAHEIAPSTAPTESQ